MTKRNILRIAAALVCCTLTPLTIAQPGRRTTDVRMRVLDQVLPLERPSRPYFLRIAMRFADSAYQAVITVYPGGESELVEYKVDGVMSGALAQVMQKLVDYPDANVDELTRGLKVSAVRSSIKSSALDQWLHKLEKIRISPALANRVGLDAVTRYEFWYDTWEESVHYSIIGPPEKATQDQLTRWMVEFRAGLPELVKAP